MRKRFVVASKIWNFDFEVSWIIALCVIIGGAALVMDLLYAWYGTTPRGHILFLLPCVMTFWAMVAYAADQWFKRATPADKRRLKDFLEGPLF